MFQEPEASVMVLLPLQVSPKLHSAVPPGKKATLEVTLLDALLDLVDRYWNGCKSLHSNEMFLGESRRDSQLMGPEPRAGPTFRLRCVRRYLFSPWVSGPRLAGPSPSAATGCCASGSILTVFLTAAGGSPEAWLLVFPAAGSGSGRHRIAWFCWKCHTQLFGSHRFVFTGIWRD